MKWPWNRAERRESSYTDLLVSLAVARAGGTTTAKVTATGALQAAAGLVSRCFALADVSGPASLTAAVTPACLSLIGRALIRSGEAVLVIDVDPGGAVRLHPASHWDIQGDVDPETWRYRVNMPAPSVTVTRSVEAAGVVHPRFETDPEAPWRGVSPLESAALAGKLSSETAAALADESSMPRGALLPLPVDGQDPTLDLLKADIRTLAGQIAFVESVKSMHPGAAASSPVGDWKTQRIGPAPTAPLVELHGTAAAEVLGACGIPAVLFASTGDGTSRREAFRQVLHSTIQPLGELVAGELSEKLEADVSLTFDRLFAADLAGRARAFQSMTGAGMELAKAAALSGLMGAEE